MGKEWTDDEVAAEISAAVQIVREDRMDKFIRERLGPSGSSPTKDPEKTAPPGKTEPGTSTPPKPKRSLWWGEIEGES